MVPSVDTKPEIMAKDRQEKKKHGVFKIIQKERIRACSFKRGMLSAAVAQQPQQYCQSKARFL